MKEIAASAGFKSALDFDIAVERRKYNYARIWKFRTDFERDVDSVQTGQPDVHQNDVGALLLANLHRFGPALGFANHLELFAVAENSLDSISHDLVIVYEKDLKRHRAIGRP